jgi:hypothetical protein
VGVVNSGGGERVCCLLMTPKLSVGKCRCSIGTLLGTLQIPQILFWLNSVWVIPGTIPAEFEFHSRFCQN